MPVEDSRAGCAPLLPDEESEIGANSRAEHSSFLEDEEARTVDNHRADGSAELSKVEKLEQKSVQMQQVMKMEYAARPRLQLSDDEMANTELEKLLNNSNSQLQGLTYIDS